MYLELFAVSLLVTLGIVMAAMLYLRGSMRRVIIDACGSERASDFWLRIADVLAFSGSAVLVLTFGTDAHPGDWLRALRTTAALALLGLFTTLVIVAIVVGGRASRMGVRPDGGSAPGSGDTLRT